MEKENLRKTAGRIRQLEVERRTASAARRAVVDSEIRSLNHRCETILAAQ
jgi:hypothetical protein